MRPYIYKRSDIETDVELPITMINTK